MGLMGLFSDATALLVQARARRTARFGGAPYFAGTDLDDPDSWRIATRHGFVRCDVYRPPGVRRPPVYVHVHAGAFMMRYPRMDDFATLVNEIDPGGKFANDLIDGWLDLR